MIVMAGDFNLDPEIVATDDVEALQHLVESVGLERLPDDGPTHRILGNDLDLVYVRGLLDTSSALCNVRFLDDAAEAPMFDHAFLSCR